MYKLIELLNNHGFHAKGYYDEELLIAEIKHIVGSGKTVGMGGSETIKELGILEKLAENNTIFATGFQPEMSREEVYDKANRADFYLSSVNAITQDGLLVNIDGTANRIGSICYGPKNVIFVVGKNKITRDLPAAMNRIKTVACSQNAKRLGLMTPCISSGFCEDCDNEERMCRATLILERPTRNRDFHVLMIDKDYGY